MSKSVKTKTVESFYQELPPKYTFKSHREKEIMRTRIFKRVNMEIDKMECDGKTLKDLFNTRYTRLLKIVCIFVERIVPETMMMEAKRMPAVFVGHGSPMLALEDSVVTRRLGQLGKEILGNYGRPKAILMVSAHWYKNRNLVQRTERPEQVYDMYGFPPELYAVKYEPKGYPALADTLLAIANLGATVDNSWGLDHGAWTLLIHMFPEADIPVVQLSVNSVLTPRQCYDIGRLLAPLRHEGYLLMGSGNVVHNLRMTNWASDHGSPEAETFNDFITDAVVRRDDEAVIQFNTHPLARYAVPTNDHFYPLLYMLGASEGERPQVFNKVCNLDSMAMTGYLFDADNK